MALPFADILASHLPDDRCVTPLNAWPLPRRLSELSPVGLDLRFSALTTLPLEPDAWLALPLAEFIESRRRLLVAGCGGEQFFEASTIEATAAAEATVVEAAASTREAPSVEVPDAGPKLVLVEARGVAGFKDLLKGTIAGTSAEKGGGHDLLLHRASSRKKK